MVGVEQVWDGGWKSWKLGRQQCYKNRIQLDVSELPLLSKQLEGIDAFLHLCGI